MTALTSQAVAADDVPDLASAGYWVLGACLVMMVFIAVDMSFIYPAKDRHWPDPLFSDASKASLESEAPSEGSYPCKI